MIKPASKAVAFARVNSSLIEKAFNGCLRFGGLNSIRARGGMYDVIRPGRRDTNAVERQVRLFMRKDGCEYEMDTRISARGKDSSVLMQSDLWMTGVNKGEIEPMETHDLLRVKGRVESDISQFAALCFNAANPLSLLWYLSAQNKGIVKMLEAFSNIAENDQVATDTAFPELLHFSELIKQNMESLTKNIPSLRKSGANDGIKAGIDQLIDDVRRSGSDAEVKDRMLDTLLRVADGNLFSDATLWSEIIAKIEKNRTISFIN